MKLHKNTAFWREFLELYKNLPALWKVKNKSYSDRIVKANSYEKLVRKLREIEPKANREMVVRKINAFRTNYRRDNKRFKKSLEDAENGKIEHCNIFRSTLWYYDALSFLDDYKEENTEEEDDEAAVEVEDEVIEEYDLGDEEEIEIPIEDMKSDAQQVIENVTIQPLQPIKMERPCIQRKRPHWNGGLEPSSSSPPATTTTSATQTFAESLHTPKTHNAKRSKSELTTPIHQQHEPEETSTNFQVTADTTSFPGAVLVDSSKLESLITLSCRQLKELNNDSAVLARTWANQFNELEKKQKTLARKLISDVLFYGCMGQLKERNVSQIQQAFEENQIEYLTTSQDYSGSE